MTACRHIIQCVMAWLFCTTHLSEAIEVKVIPEYTNGYHQAGNFKCEVSCVFSGNPTSPDAEFYLVMDDNNLRYAANVESDVIKLVGSQEPPHYWKLLNLQYLRKHFHGTALLDRKSDIPWPLHGDMDKVKSVKKPKGALPKATFVAKNCDPMNNRNDYIRAIDQLIGVVSPGACYHNLDWPDCSGVPCTKVQVLSNYKIYLAFENGDSPGFITDKIYHAFEAGVLPVWMGTSDIEYVVPKHSYIDVAEYDSPEDLALYLRDVVENETLYNSYFKWKDVPFPLELVRLNRRVWSELMQCRMCLYIDSLQKGLTWDHTLQRGRSGAKKKYFKEPVEISDAMNVVWFEEYEQMNCWKLIFPFIFVFLLISSLLCVRRRLIKRLLSSLTS